MNRTDLFTAYNAGRKLAKEGKLDAGRLNRALGIAQSHKPRLVSYVTTDADCSCPDHRYRGSTCKHLIARALLSSAQEAA